MVRNTELTPCHFFGLIILKEFQSYTKDLFIAEHITGCGLHLNLPFFQN